MKQIRLVKVSRKVSCAPNCLFVIALYNVCIGINFVLCVFSFFIYLWLTIDDSDLATIYNAYVAWRSRFSGKILPGGYRAAKEYCRIHYLSFQNMEMIEDMKKQFLGLLVSIGFLQMDQQELASDINTYRLKRSERFCQVPAKYNIYGDTIAVVNAAIAAALYPKFAFNAKHTKKLVYGVKNDVVHIHPSSILSRSSNRIQSNFLMFNTITNSDKTYLWDVAALDDVAVLLFGGRMDILVSARSSLKWNIGVIY